MIEGYEAAQRSYDMQEPEFEPKGLLHDIKDKDSDYYYLNATNIVEALGESFDHDIKLKQEFECALQEGNNIEVANMVKSISLRYWADYVETIS